jgi:hypothetical protein
MYEIVMTATSNRIYYHKVQDHSHYQHLILHNREFRSFGNRKSYVKSTTVTLQGNDVRVHLCLHCITVNNKIIIIFLSEKFFPYFFHVHLNILDKVVSSLYAQFGTPCMYITYVHINFTCYLTK